MHLYFVDRSTYRSKHDAEYLKALRTKFGNFYFIPEGGTNELAVKGTQEIMAEIPDTYKAIACCVGTGGTMAGLIEGSANTQLILGFPALKGDWIFDEVRQWTAKTNWDIHLDYHFGGYAKWTQALIDFINDFKRATGIPLDPIYTGKMLYGIVDLIKKDQLSSDELLIIHSGGLQGIAGFNERFGGIIEV